MHFADNLLEQIEKKQSPLCIGLDPHFDKIPEKFKKGRTGAQAIEFFLSEILEAVSPYCACVKPNTAFFELFGSEGWKVLEKVSQKAKSMGLLVIADAKRGDIGSTAAAYAEAFLGEKSPYDAITISPYLGQDGILPFLEKAEENEKGVFVLVKNSNESSGEFQDLPVGDVLLHEEVARSVARLGMGAVGKSGFSALGGVVGATHPDDLRILRKEMPSQIFLVPGFGAQGGSAKDVSGAFYSDGRGAIVNSSRGILFAKEGAEKAAAKAAKDLREVSLGNEEKINY